MHDSQKKILLSLSVHGPHSILPHHAPTGTATKTLFLIESSNSARPSTSATMKVLTANYLTCAVKTCKSEPAAFPLHFKDAELAREELELNPEFLKNVLPRIDWPALVQTAAEVGFGPDCKASAVLTVWVAWVYDTPQSEAGESRRSNDEGPAYSFNGGM